MKFTLFLGFVVGPILIVASDYAVSSTLDEEWKNWKLQYNKDYAKDEEINRRIIWESAMSYIEQHNREYAMGKHTFTVAMNQFGDLTNKEFNMLMNTFFRNKAENSTEEQVKESNELDDADNENVSKRPSTVDWRDKNLVTRVKNQGPCGSCWAFSATGALEGQWAKKKKQLISLSEQNMLDCDCNSNGCNGGYMESAYKCIIQLGGIESEKSYPYTGQQGSCRFQRNNIVAKIKTYHRLDINEARLARKVAKIGPLCIAVDASLNSFQYYSQGVYYDPHCNQNGVNHAMLLIGYGTEKGGKYWLIKNSWGTSWGDNGYIKMSRDKNNNCGITDYVIFPVV
ncbi:cathepsin K-like [Mobula birostris]|uniref:cathepsin K-like n=1 Tax=Mobula birostris TaxID=1983395 RepID=UPI003B289862